MAERMLQEGQAAAAVATFNSGEWTISVVKGAISAIQNLLKRVNKEAKAAAPSPPALAARTIDAARSRGSTPGTTRLATSRSAWLAGKTTTWP